MTTMDTEVYPLFCLVCGDDTVQELIYQRLSSGTSVFQCFLKLFGVKWKGKNFGFCDTCKVQLTLIGELQWELKGLKKKLREHENGLLERLESSEAKFKTKKVYEVDHRYLRIRRQIVNATGKTEKSTSSTDLKVASPKDSNAQVPQNDEHKVDLDLVKVEVSDESMNEENDANQDEDARNETFNECIDDPPVEDNNALSSPIRGKRRRAPPQRLIQEDIKPKKRKSQIIKQEEEKEDDAGSGICQGQDDDDADDNNDKDFLPSSDVVNNAEDEATADDAEVKKKQKGKRKRSKRTVPSRVSSDQPTIVIHKILLTKQDSAEDSYKCSVCDAILPNKLFTMRAHVIKNHTSIFACPHCDKRFDRRSILKRHVDYTHNKIMLEANLNCPICQRPFARPDHMRGHTWTHFSEEDKMEALARGEKPPYGYSNEFQCSQDGCRRKFFSSRKLEKHVNEMHGDTTPGRVRKLCGVCGLSVGNLFIHMELKHKAYEDRKHTCSLCGKKFAFCAQLSIHRRQAHVTEKPWKCEVCGRGFKLENQMKEHRLGHDDVKPFECHLCGMGFTRNYVLARHVSNVHEGKERADHKKKKTKLKINVEVFDDGKAAVI